MKCVALIPSYEPTDKLEGIIGDLTSLDRFDIIVVNDGSNSSYDKYFNRIKDRVTYLSYDENHGKGYALKTGFEYIKDNYDDCVVVTLDSDGQHTAKDTLNICDKVSQKDDTILLGKRLRGEHTPLRSKIGNSITRVVFRLSTGIDVYDTQTGLRAFKSSLLPFMLGVKGDRFEYEMNMLLEAPRKNIKLEEETIETIYEDNNSGSHFNTIKDSFRIYKQIFKFMFASVSSFVVDYLLYTLLNVFTGNLILSNIVARVFSSAFNYTVNRNMVFKDKNSIAKSMIKYYILAAFILLVNTIALTILSTFINKYIAKIIIETILFIISYFVQKRFIF